MASPEHTQAEKETKAVTGRTRDLVVAADKAIFRLAKHWLALLNLFWGLYVGLPFLAPVFMNAGWTMAAKVIYTLYRPACHQRPWRSYFLGGAKVLYSTEELQAAGVSLDPLVRDIGNEAVGWKVAFCERDVAIYGALFVAGLVFALVRPRLGEWRMSFRHFLLFLIPMALDGGLQLFGFYESDWLRRSITGIIFAVGAVLFAYPYAEEGFADVRRTINSKLHLE